MVSTEIDAVTGQHIYRLFGEYDSLIAAKADEVSQPFLKTCIQILIKNRTLIGGIYLDSYNQLWHRDTMTDSLQKIKEFRFYRKWTNGRYYFTWINHIDEYILK